MIRLLFDQNLSPRLVARLTHVSTLGLDTALDSAIWEYARQHGFTIVTKDADFGELSILLGFPPKVVWIRRGNCSTRDIETLLRDSRDAIVALDNDPQTGVLVLF